jgi:tetratricopeptide (TPR) repeat protein
MISALRELMTEMPEANTETKPKDEVAPAPAAPTSLPVVSIERPADESDAGDDEDDDGHDDDEDDEEGDDDDDDEIREELEETIAIATERLVGTPDDVAALLFRGEALDDLGERDRARTDLERAAVLAPASAAAQLAWARWLFAGDEEDRALEAAERAIEIGEAKGALSQIDQETGWNDIGRARARYLKAALLAGREALEEALTELDVSLRFDPDDARTLLLRGEVRHATGDLDGALVDLGKSVSFDPEDSEARLARAEALLDSGEVAAAYSEVEAAIDLAGDDPTLEMLVVRGEVRLAEGDIESARADFTRAAELDPDSVDPRLGIVDAALAANDLDAAEVAAKEALRLDPEHPQALVFKARVDLVRGRHAEAEKSCSKAIEIDASAADAFALRSEARRKLGKLSQARHDAATARALGFDLEDPDHKAHGGK